MLSYRPITEVTRMFSGIAENLKIAYRWVRQELRHYPNYALGPIHRLQFYWRHNRLSLVQFVLSALTVLLFIFGYIERNQLGTFFAWAAGAVTLLISLRRYIDASHFKLRSEQYFPPIGFSAAVAAEGKRLLNVSNHIALIDDELNRALIDVPVRVQLDTRRYELPADTREHLSDLLSKKAKIRTINERKAKIASSFTANEVKRGKPVTIQQTDYFSGLITHELGKDAYGRLDGADISAGSKFYFENGKIIPLDLSAGSNHLGVTTIAITIDQRIVYVREISGIYNKVQLAASGSGSLDWEDVEKVVEAEGSRVTLQELLALGMERELHEESGATDDPTKQKTYVTGFARLIDRGGKPDFYGITFLHQPSNDLKVPKKDAVYTGEIKSFPVPSFAKADVVRILEQEFVSHMGRNDTSLTFILALHFAAEFLKMQSDDFLRMQFTERQSQPN